jgi:type IV pilus assembly protein PilQ
VQVNQTSAGLEVVLETREGDRPQIFTVAQDNALTADIINTQLDLPQGNGYLQNNPAPGISSIMITQLDANSIRVTVNGEAAAPVAQTQQTDDGILLSYVLTNGDAPTAVAPETANPASTDPAIAQAPPSDTPEGVPVPVEPVQAQAPPPVAPAPEEAPAPAVPPPDILVPNPEIMIDGVPAQPPTAGLVPPLIPRAVAPPLGDIAVSTLDSSPASIDLGTEERVPRLVLRDAPAREVLSLLARAAGLNVAYIGQDPGAPVDAAAPPLVPGQEAAGIRVSLDIENEPVQNVFNYVLRIAGLEANRVGRTIFVGPRLPDDARNVVTRTLRLNQVSVTDAANFLTAQGAETQIPIERVEIQTVGEGAAARTIEIRTPEILNLRAQEGTGPLLLRGLSVLTNSRLNAITLVGNPRKVEVATSLLAQLDLRQRQVAINVKIVDVNLLATEDFNTSFSFGIGDAFFTSDGGALSFNYGGVRPPSADETRGSRLSPPITGAPFPGDEDLEPFLDAQPDAPFGTGEPQPFGVPSLNDGTIQEGGSVFPRPPFGTDDNPLQPGVTEINEDEIDFGLPELFRYPTRFLAALQAQVVSGNAKILTDPTLVVQEGQTASVNLTQEVVGNIRSETETTDGLTTRTVTAEIEEAGLILQIEIRRIDDNGFVTLAVNPRVTSIGSVQDLSLGDDTNEIALLNVRELASGQIRLRDGQTLILSGIIQETDRTTISKIPILGDLPIIGALFRSTSRENTRAEVIVLLTPQILDDSDLSTFGYSYTPSQDTQQLLQRQGVQTP